MDRSERIKRCVACYQMMRMIHDQNMMLFIVLTLFVYFRDRNSGQTALGGRVNSMVRRDALDSADVEEQVAEEQEEDQTPPLDEFDFSVNSSVNGPSQGLGNELKASATSEEAAGASARLSGKKRKRMDILEKMVEIVQLSIKAQEKNIEILADAIYGVNDRFKFGEKLESLGFGDDEVVQVALKFSENPNLCSIFWGLTDTQKSLLIRTILGSN